MDGEKSRILIFGASGYLGKYLVKASISMGHPTHAYVRPLNSSTPPSKLQLLNHFQSKGVTLHHGELNEMDKMIEAVKEVDIVISALAVPQHLDQLNIIKAIQLANNNIKRFMPSEFGNEVDRTSRALPPFQKLLDIKKKIRRAIEEAAIPFTYMCANSFAAYFVDYLLHPNCPSSNQITIYGTGHAKAVLNYEEDVAVYSVKAASDPRTANRVVICRPPKNIISQIDLVASWEKKTGRTFQRDYVTNHQLILLADNLPFPDNIPVAILHNIFVVGEQLSFELQKDDLEASNLYPHYKYTSLDDLLNRCLLNPPKPKLATFA